MELPRPRALEAGLLLAAFGLPIVFTPFTANPFVDGKLVLTAAAALLLWVSGLRGDRRLGRFAAAWLAVSTVAALSGVDPLRSLYGLESQGAGLLLLVPCGVLLMLGSGVPDELLPRLARWIAIAAAIVAAIGVLHRLAPGVLETLVPKLDLGGSTAGNPVFSSALMATGIAALLGIPRLRPVWLVVALIVLASGLATVGERVAWATPAIAVPIALWRGRVPRSRSFLVAGIVVSVLIGWVAIGPLLPSGDAESVTTQFGQFETDKDRLVVWGAMARGFGERPMLGWGPSNAWSAYLHAASGSDLEAATRRWSDAHDLVLQSLVTTGVLGTLPLLALGWLVLSGMSRAPANRGWAVGAAAMLGAFHLFEPLNPTVTPLLFLLAGLACAHSPPDGTPARTRSRQATTAGLAVVLAITLLVAAASTLEQWGRTYGEEWALHASMRLQPGRITAAEKLSILLALDGRAGDPAAAEEARRLVADTVALHPWDPNVRPTAADVETLLKDFEAARDWIRRQLERFPADEASFPPEATGSTTGLATSGNPFPAPT